MESPGARGAACASYTGPNTTWVALVKRGGCPFENKFDNVVGSAATIVYDSTYNQNKITMDHGPYNKGNVWL